MRLSLWRTLLGIFMIVLGAALFAQNSGLLPGIDAYWGFIIAALLALGGLAFIYTLIEDHSKWWAIIPGITLTGLAGLIVLAFSSPRLGEVAAAVFMASIGLSFLLVYLLRRDFWWALIPSLVMLGLAVMMALIGASTLLQWSIPGQLPAAFFLAFIGLGFLVVYLVHRENWWPVIPAGAMISVSLLVGTASLGSLFLGLGLTFGLLSLLPSSGGRMHWPLIPAAVMFLLGLLFNHGRNMWGNYVFPSLLILAGLFMIGRAVLQNTRNRGSGYE